MMGVELGYDHRLQNLEEKITKLEAIHERLRENINTLRKGLIYYEFKYPADSEIARTAMELSSK